MGAVYRRELTSYFTTPIGYVFVAVFLALSGAVFAATTLFAMSSDVTEYFSYMLFLYVVLLPLLTMKSFSEERKTRTEQLILTSPVSLFGMVMGKFLAALTMFGGCQLLASTVFLVLARYAEIKVAVLFGNILAILLVGISFLSVGLFVSAITENQLTAAIGTIAILLFFLLISFLNQIVNVYWIRFLINCVSIWSRFQNFSQGIFDLSSLFYYLSVSAVFLFLTIRVYDRRRYN